jgi:hypothetical protein
MFNKLATSIETSVELSFSVPDEEKKAAQVASERFEHVVSALDGAIEHLSIIYDPLKEAGEISVEAVVERRGIINRYMQKSKENFNKVKQRALYAIKDLNRFSSDSKIGELVNSFVDSIDDLETAVSKFLTALEDNDSPEFKDNIISSVDLIKETASRTENLIYDRIIEYIDDNILAKNWMTIDDSGIQSEISENVPYISRLVDEREKAMEGGSFVDTPKDIQSLNPSDAQRMYYPDFSRTVNIGGEDDS